MKRISQLLQDIETQEIIGDESRMVLEVCTDSRRVAAGAMFVAVRGVNVDSHRFIDQVVDAGVAAVVCEEFPDRIESTVTYIKVANSAVALGYIASAWHDCPSRRLTLVGVTGTNGKTTVATLLYEAAMMRGHKAGLLSTVVNRIGETAVEATHTTPDPLTLNALLARMVDEGCTHAFMEVSSHAAHQHRIAGLRWAGGIFTNITRDHLDYHKTFAAYLAAKKSFFDCLPRTAWALTNADDRNGAVMLQNTRAERHTYSLASVGADFNGRIVENRLDGMLITLNGHEVETRFTGRYNAANLTAVYGALRLLGEPDDEALVDISRLVPVAGRFQTFASRSGITAVVDYAHTPDAVANLLAAVRDVLGNRGNIITVIGAGGNRDAGKRPIMAREAARASQRVILTADNPRDEDPADIIAQMKEGLDGEAMRITLAIADRAEAIRTAIALAAPGDVVVVAGKGHETYQEIKGVRHHFDDREIVAAELAHIDETNR